MKCNLIELIVIYGLKYKKKRMLIKKLRLVFLKTKSKLDPGIINHEIDVILGISSVGQLINWNR